MCYQDAHLGCCVRAESVAAVGFPPSHLMLSPLTLIACADRHLRPWGPGAAGSSAWCKVRSPRLGEREGTVLLPCKHRLCGTALQGANGHSSHRACGATLLPCQSCPRRSLSFVKRLTSCPQTPCTWWHDSMAPFRGDGGQHAPVPPPEKEGRRWPSCWAERRTWPGAALLPVPLAGRAPGTPSAESQEGSPCPSVQVGMPWDKARAMGTA